MFAHSNNISVIIPTYNRKLLVEKTIQNILEQSLVPSEIIVVDDHSDDGTLEFLKNIFNERITLILNKGEGPGAARNTGLEIATGDYIKFFDSDDLMTRNTIEVQFNALSTSKTSFVYSPYFFAEQGTSANWNIDQEIILGYYNGIKNEGLRKNMCKGLFICIPSMLFKREFLERVGPWPNDIVAYEDWEFLWRISHFENHPSHTNDCAFLYRVHEQQTTRDNYDNRNRDLQKMKSFHRILTNDFDYFATAPKSQKLNFLVLMYETWIIYKKDNDFETFSFLNRIDLKVVYYFKRLKVKIGRLRTGTKWQPMHGVYKSYDTINSYLKQID
jgi:glycosyltransferase involved in cell wall biosynthesis